MPEIAVAPTFDTVRINGLPVWRIAVDGWGDASAFGGSPNFIKLPGGIRGLAIAPDSMVHKVMVFMKTGGPAQVAPLGSRTYFDAQVPVTSRVPISFDSVLTSVVPAWETTYTTKLGTVVDPKATTASGEDLQVDTRLVLHAFTAQSPVLPSKRSTYFTRFQWDTASGGEVTLARIPCGGRRSVRINLDASGSWSYRILGRSVYTTFDQIGNVNVESAMAVELVPSTAIGSGVQQTVFLDEIGGFAFLDVLGTKTSGGILEGFVTLED